MKIGTLLTLEIQHPDINEYQKYRCKVVEKNDYYLFIDYPIESRTNKTSFLPKGTHCRATYVGKDKSVYSFKTKIVANVIKNIPTLAIHFPAVEDITRIQRREYVRVETAVDIAIHGPNDPFVTVTSDISGGGMCIILPNEAIVNENDTLNIWAVLHTQSEVNRYVNASAVVISVKESKNSVALASLKFTSIENHARQSIIQYCFEKQREARKKELL